METIPVVFKLAGKLDIYDRRHRTAKQIGKNVYNRPVNDHGAPQGTVMFHVRFWHLFQCSGWIHFEVFVEFRGGRGPKMSQMELVWWPKALQFSAMCAMFGSMMSG